MLLRCQLRRYRGFASAWPTSSDVHRDETMRKVAGLGSAGVAEAVHARPDRQRLALMALLLVAAMPVRIPINVPLVGSISILDVFLVLASATLILDLPSRRLNWGYSSLPVLMAVPTVVSLMSVIWSDDRVATLNSTIVYLEGILAYLFVVRELEMLSPDRVVAYIRRFALLVTIPAVLLLLHVPGFEPYDPALSESSGDYISYYTRLSHPILGRSNNLAAVLFIFVPPLLYWGHTRRKLYASLVGFLSLVAVAATLSRGLLLSVLIAGLVYAALLRRAPHTSRRPLIGKFLAMAIGLAIAATAFYQLNPPTREFLAGRLSATNVELRVDLYVQAFRQTLDRPLLGYGGDALGSHSSALAVDVHNTYLQQILNFGVPLGVLVGLAIAALPVPFLLRRRICPLAGAIGFAVLVEVISFSFESSFEGTVLRVIFFLSLGLLVGLLKAAEAEMSVSPPVASAISGKNGRAYKAGKAYQ